MQGAEQDETGQSFRGSHAYVEYHIPHNAGRTPLIFVHGYGGSGDTVSTMVG